MALDAFLKIDGIPGESADEAHKDWIEVLGYSHGMTQSFLGVGQTAGKRSSGRCQLSDFSIVKVVDKASALLAKALCCNSAIKEVKVELCRAAGKKEKYLEYTLSDAGVSGIHAGKNPQANEGLPTEEVAFGYNKITWTYFQTDLKTGKPKGSIEFQYELAKDEGH